MDKKRSIYYKANTIYLPIPMNRKLKAFAANSGVTVSDIVEELTRNLLDKIYGDGIS